MTVKRAFTCLSVVPSIRSFVTSAFALVCLTLSVVANAQAQILVVAPHPDDDLLIGAGVIARAVGRGEPVRVVYVTNGDYYGTSAGYTRQVEAVNGQAVLGVPESQLVFLGYPDGSLKTIKDNYTSSGQFFVSPQGISSTYGNRGLGSMDYHRYRYGSPGAYNWPTMVGDLQDYINTYRPKHIFTVTPTDTHLDHSTTYALVTQATTGVIAGASGYNPTIHRMIVHSNDDNAWPAFHDVSAYFTDYPRPAGDTAVWANRESLDVPLALQSTVNASNPKFVAIERHISQGGMGSFLGRFVHKDEFFWTGQLTGSNLPPIPDAGPGQTVGPGSTVTLDGSGSRDPNGTALTYQWRQAAGTAVTLSSASVSRPTFVAPTGLTTSVSLEFELVVSDGALTSVADAVVVTVSPVTLSGTNFAASASVTASSETASTGQAALKAIDGVIAGYPTDATKEWATAGQGAGAWIQLNWASPVTVNTVLLYDRPNTSDQILGGTLTFSNGAAVAVGALANSGGGTIVFFPSRTITWVRLDITSVSSTTANVGLAEFEVRAADNATPTANAGPDQNVSPLAAVTLTGLASTDANGDPLTYAWSQTGGPTVTLSGTASAQPTFQAPAGAATAQTLTFALTVSDGQSTSAADSVVITVAALPPTIASFVAVPTNTVIIRGTAAGGGAASLTADDNAYYTVASTTNSTRTTEWYGSFTGISTQLSNLRVNYKGNNSSSCSQTVAIWRWTTNSWIQLHSATVGTTEVAASNLAPSGTLSDYVSGTGELRVRVRCTKSSNFTARGDLLTVTYDAPVADTTAPVRSNGAPSGALAAGTTQATLSLTTNESAVCRYGSSANVVYASQPNLFATSGGTAHSAVVTGLASGTSYSYYVRCQDSSGNVNTTDYPLTFSIAAPAASIVQVTPNTGVVGASGLVLTITGQLTAWANGATTVNLGSGVTASTTVVSPTQLVATVTVAANATIGARTITVTTGSQVLTLANGFSVVAAFTPIRVNAGGPSYVDTLGRTWAADYGFVGAGGTFTTGATIAGTTDQTLYRSEHWGALAYAFAVPNGSYSVTMKFAEIAFASTGARRFSVAIEGQTVLNDFDIFATAGANTAVDRTFLVQVTDGTLNIVCTNIVDDAKISALEIVAGP